MANVLISGAGSEELNGVYTKRGISNDKPFYNLVGRPTDDANFVVKWVSTFDTSRWEIVREPPLAFYYNNSDDNNFPWEGAWITEIGGAGGSAPTVAEYYYPLNPSFSLKFLGQILYWESLPLILGGRWISPLPAENDLVSSRVVITPYPGSYFDQPESVLVGEMIYVFNHNGTGTPQITAKLLDLTAAISGAQVFDFTNQTGFYGLFPSVYFDENGAPQAPTNLTFTTTQRTLQIFHPFNGSAGHPHSGFTAQKGFLARHGFRSENGFRASKGHTPGDGF